jgi:hypothetical protein
MGSRNYSRELLPSRLICFVLQASIGAEMERWQVLAQQKSRVHRPAFFVTAIITVNVERGSSRG